MGLYRENGNYYNILDNGKGNGNHRDYRVQGDHRGHDASTKSGVKSGEFFAGARRALKATNRAINCDRLELSMQKGQRLECRSFYYSIIILKHYYC